MSEFSRRVFLLRGSATAAAAGLVAALPVVPAALTALEADAPEATGEASTAAGEAGAVSGELSAPLVAHVKDLSSGEMAIYSGNTEVTYRDPALAARIFRAAR